MIALPLYRAKILAAAGAFLLLAFATVPSARAGTIVQISTSLGDFSIELFDEVTPVTVANFLSYVNSGAYNGTVIHRSVPGFVVQGGGFTLDEQSGFLNAIAIDQAIVNEFNIPNTRGTLAMAKLDGDPDSATSQWFVNVADNRANLDAQNGGFTVFATVLDNGMEVVDDINSLPTVSGDVPVINLIGNTVTSANLVEISMAVVQPMQDAPNFFDNTSGLLNVSVDTGTSGLFALSFSVFATEPQTVIQVETDTVVSLSQTVANIATFNEANGRLTIPELVIDEVVVFRNVIFELSDAANLRFTLVSFE